MGLEATAVALSGSGSEDLTWGVVGMGPQCCGNVDALVLTGQTVFIL